MAETPKLHRHTVKKIKGKDAWIIINNEGHKIGLMTKGDDRKEAMEIWQEYVKKD